ncbi:uncharacterized protein [Branchiostoma lanceolatum]|uniref:uncharacterized protein n=1 Tax=Branchiostoma lanceolatum TaxID=7740 RepID=UPI0034564CEB
MGEPDFLDLHNFLANDIIRTREGGAGWMVDLALNADRCNPKTFLLKTTKCSGNGSIVLEPALSPQNYINPKSAESMGGFFAAFSSKTSVQQSINESLSEESVKTIVVSESSAVSQHKYACVKTMDAWGRVRFRIAPNAGIGASMTSTKSTSSSVEVFCEDLVRRSVDFEDLRGALEEHTVNTRATNIRGEHSLFIVTDVIVAGKISWEVKQNVESKKRGGGNVEVESVNVEAGAGISSQRPEEHRQVVNNAVLALKFAKISYDDQGKIVGMDKSGNFEGNYTLGPGTEERERRTAIIVLGGGENIRKGSRLNIRYISQEKRGGGRRGLLQSDSHVHGDRVYLRSILETGKHQKFTKWMQLPLKGLVVTKENNNSYSRHRIPWKKKKQERIYLKKVSVTDVEADSTFTCIGNSQLDIPKRDSWVWLDCKQWRDSLTKSDIQVEVEFEGSIRTLTVDAEDPVIVIMHKMRDRVPCHKQVLTYKGTKIKYPADTVKDVGIKDGDQLTLLVEENRKNIPDVWEGAPIPILYPQGGPTPRFQGPEAISYKGSVSLPFQDIQSMGTKYPELKMDEARVKHVLEAELSEDEDDLADISPVGFQQLMEALGKKVDLDDILKAVVTHEDSSDEDDQFSVLDMMTSSFEGRSLFKDGDLRIDASTADRIASLKCMMNPGPLRTVRSSPFSWLNDPDLPYTDASNNVRVFRYI